MDIMQRTISIEGLNKEILTQSDNLAVTLAMRRNYTVPLPAGVFEIDPRFLLFEFCHGLLLRPSQVQLVTKLLAEMEAGHSVCHQVSHCPHTSYPLLFTCDIANKIIQYFLHNQSSFTVSSSSLLPLIGIIHAMFITDLSPLPLSR